MMYTLNLYYISQQTGRKTKEMKKTKKEKLRKEKNTITNYQQSDTEDISKCLLNIKLT